MSADRYVGKTQPFPLMEWERNDLEQVLSKISAVCDGTMQGDYGDAPRSWVVRLMLSKAVDRIMDTIRSIDARTEEAATSEAAVEAEEAGT